MIGFALKLLGFGRWLKQVAAKAWELVCKYPLPCAVIALLALSAWLWLGKSHALDELDASRAETANLIVSYKRAQAEAEQAQTAANSANVQSQIERNKGIVNAHASNKIAAASAIAGYKRLHPASSACASRRTPAASLHPDTEAPAGAGDLTGLLIITERNFDLSSTAALRGAECTGYLGTLVRAGLAVSE